MESLRDIEILSKSVNCGLDRLSGLNALFADLEILHCNLMDFQHDTAEPTKFILNKLKSFSCCIDLETPTGIIDNLPNTLTCLNLFCYDEPAEDLTSWTNQWSRIGNNLKSLSFIDPSKYLSIPLVMLSPNLQHLRACCAWNDYQKLVTSVPPHVKSLDLWWPHSIHALNSLLTRERDLKLTRSPQLIIVYDESEGEEAQRVNRWCLTKGIVLHIRKWSNEAGVVEDWIPPIVASESRE